MLLVMIFVSCEGSHCKTKYSKTVEVEFHLVISYWQNGIACILLDHKLEIEYFSACMAANTSIVFLMYCAQGFPEVNSEEILLSIPWNCAGRISGGLTRKFYGKIFGGLPERLQNEFSIKILKFFFQRVCFIEDISEEPVNKSRNSL